MDRNTLPDLPPLFSNGRRIQPVPASPDVPKPVLVTVEKPPLVPAIPLAQTSPGSNRLNSQAVILLPNARHFNAEWNGFRKGQNLPVTAELFTIQVPKDLPGRKVYSYLWYEQADANPANFSKVTAELSLSIGGAIVGVIPISFVNDPTGEGTETVLTAAVSAQSATEGCLTAFLSSPFGATEPAVSVLLSPYPVDRQFDLLTAKVTAATNVGQARLFVSVYAY